MTPPIDYIRVESDILHRQDLSCSEKLVLGLVKSFNGNGFKLPNDEIALLLNIRPDSVSRIFTKLKSKKLISICNPQSRFRKIYFGENPKVELRGKSQSKPSTLDFHPTTLEKTPNITKVNKQTKPSGGDDVSMSFEVFWKSYPKKVSKPQAMKAFSKLNPDDALLSVMMPALERHKQTGQWKKDTGQYIPNPATWLNGRRWEDKLTIDGDCPPPREITEAEADEIFQKAGIAV